ncbi:MAG TPA: neutral/alkaline non-lysosomal ceramidase N-terminal domain-containing protein, partial [Gemmataceae bacterium]
MIGTRWGGFVGAAAALLLAAAPAAAQEKKGAGGGAAGWKAGFGRAEITPDRPVWMSGYAARKKPSEGVAAEIFVKAMALEDQRGERAVLVTADLIGTWGFFSDPVVEAVAEKVGVPRERFLFTSSHNHAGPTISLNPEGRGSMPKAEAENTVKYTREVQEKLAGAIRDAVADLKPARLSWGVGFAPFVMNRREFTDRGVILGENPRGPADRSVPVLRVDGPDGKLRGAVFGCACHNTTLTQNNYQIAGDYAGFAQETIEAKYPGAHALFVAGCGGDANPYPRGTLELATVHGRTLGAEVCRVLESKLAPVGGPLQIASGVARLPFQAGLSPEELAEV